MATSASIASSYTPGPQQPDSETTRPTIVPRKSKCSEGFHVRYSKLTVLRDIQTMTSGGKSVFYGGICGIAERTKLNKDTVRLAMNQLIVTGWLVPEGEWKNGQGRRFTVLTHDQWVEVRGRSGGPCR